MKKTKQSTHSKAAASKGKGKGKGAMALKKGVTGSKQKAPKRAPAAKVVPPPEVEQREPKKLKLSKDDIAKYKHLLLELRDHLIDGVNFLATDNLKRSHREASGELSGYSLHMADAGTDNFDREFALSLVSSEQEALYEIEEALKRLEHGTYGLCGMCEKPIRKERLQAVPFARLCITCQAGVEKEGRRPVQVTGVFSEHTDDEGGDGEESEE
jgi:RNA polymerase-binding transcription factor DksA